MLIKGLKTFIRRTSPCGCKVAGYCSVHLREMNRKEWKRCRRNLIWYQMYQRKKFEFLDNQLPDSERFNPTCRASVQSHIGTGPGTELILLLASRWWPWFGISTSTTCKCKLHAAIMNQEGVDWVASNVTDVVGWLQQEHSRQDVRVSFLNVVASALVCVAVRRARRRVN